MKVNQKMSKINNVAKVKICLNSNKEKANLSCESKLSQSSKSKSFKIYQQIMSKKPKERNLKSISHNAKQTSNIQKVPTSDSRPSFKPQTTRTNKHLGSYNQKVAIKPKNRLKISRLGHLNKSSKYQGMRGGKPLMSSNPKDNIKRRSNNKISINYAKEKYDITKKFTKHIPISVPKYKKNVTSGGSYSSIQAKGTLNRKYIHGKGSRLEYSNDAGVSNSKLKNSYSKQMKRIKQKSSHTFADLSRISLILSKGSMPQGNYQPHI